MACEVRKPRVTVVGGANMDVAGRPLGTLRLRDSNPGRVSVRPGGVGRNIAHDLCLLGLEVSLISAVGDDFFGEGLKQSCRALGMDTSLLLTLPDGRTSTYLYVSGEDGDMHVGIADMDITAALTPAYLASCLGKLNRSDAVVLDANLSAETIDYLAEHCLVPLYADPVSTAKAPRLKNALPKLRALKPNALEAETLTGEREPAAAARALLDMGAQRVFVSLGAEGILAAQGDAMLKLPCLPGEIVNTNGAGDAAMAAIVWAGVHGLDLGEAAAAALKAGALTAACGETNPPALNLE